MNLQEWLAANPGKGINDYYARDIASPVNEQPPDLAALERSITRGDEGPSPTGVYSLPMNIVDPSAFFHRDVKRKLELHQCAFVSGATINGAYYWMMSRYVLFGATDTEVSLLSGTTDVHPVVIEAAYLPVSKQLYEKYNNKQTKRKDSLLTTSLLTYALFPVLFIATVLLLPFFGVEIPAVVTASVAIGFLVLAVLAVIVIPFFGVDKYEKEKVENVVPLPGDNWIYGIPEGDFRNLKMKDFKEFLTGEELSVLVRDRKLVGVQWE